MVELELERGVARVRRQDTGYYTEPRDHTRVAIQVRLRLRRRIRLSLALTLPLTLAIFVTLTLTLSTHAWPSRGELPRSSSLAAWMAMARLPARR